MEDKIKNEIDEWLKIDQEKSDEIKKWEDKFKEFKDKLAEMNKRQQELLGFEGRQEIHFGDVVNLLVKLGVLK